MDYPIGSVGDGAIYCDECSDAESLQESPVFEPNIPGLEHLAIQEGESCGGCSRFWADGYWNPLRDCDTFRWATCPHCNAQKPFPRDDRDARLAARHGELPCDSCLKSLRF